MCFSGSDDRFDTPHDYTQTIFMEIPHFRACITTSHTACKPELRAQHQQQRYNLEKAAPNDSPCQAAASF